MSGESSWDAREAKILAAISEAVERGADPNSAARAAVPELSEDLYKETLASLAEGGFVHAQVTRVASGKIGPLFVERLAPRGLEEVGRWRGARSELSLSEPSSVPELTVEPGDEDRRRWVFLVQGRNRDAVEAVTALLESANLRVLEWEHAVQHAIQATGKGSPYIGEILMEGMERCHAVVVLFTPDDIGSLHPSLWNPDSPEPDEQQLRARARQNVVFEAGMALGQDEARTILVELGRVAGFSDIAGRHAVRLDDSPQQRKALLDRLKVVGCDVDLSGTRWMRAGDLSAALTTLDGYRLVRDNDSGVVVGPSPQIGHAASSVVTQWRPVGIGGAHATDLVVACVAQVPAGPGITHDPKGRLATLLRGEEREERLARILTGSPVTGWLAQAARSFHVADPLPEWAATGYNTGEWSELAIAPAGPHPLPPLVSVHCKVDTGWVVHPDGRGPGLVLFTELRFRLLELDANRRPGELRHETTSAPAPAALSLEETIEALVAALGTADTAAMACFDLTGRSCTTGQAALWITALGGAIDRVIDLTEFQLIPGSSSAGEHFVHVQLPLEGATGQLVDEPSARHVAVHLLSELLEKSGRRGASERLAMLARSEVVGSEEPHDDAVWRSGVEHRSSGLTLWVERPSGDRRYITRCLIQPTGGGTRWEWANPMEGRSSRLEVAFPEQFENAPLVPLVVGYDYAWEVADHPIAWLAKKREFVITGSCDSW